MASLPTITESGVLYDVQHSGKKRAFAGYFSGRPKATPAAFRGPTLLRILRWLERFSPPKVLLTFLVDSEPKKPITFPETKNPEKIETARAQTITRRLRVARKV